MILSSRSTGSRWLSFLHRAGSARLRQTFPNVVIFAADERYLQLAWHAAAEVAAEPGRNFDVVLLVVGTAPPPAPPGCQALGVTLPRWLKRFPVPPHMSMANYARLFAAEHWLAGWERALYLDSDVRVTAPLSPLFGLEFGGALAAMAQDCGYCRRDAAAGAQREAMLRAIGLDPQAPYFNSGVMLIDLPAWRRAKPLRHLSGFKKAQSKLSGSVDQDFVNWVTKGGVLELSPRWNFQTHYLGLGLEAAFQPGVWHYLDILKPWRDPEWAELYDGAHAACFATRLAADRLFGPGLAPPMRQRAHPDAVFAAHVANIRRERPGMKERVTARLLATLPRYADLAPAEKAVWAQALGAA